MSKARNRKKQVQSRWQRVSLDFVKTFVISLVIALAVKTSIVEAYMIPTGSMENALYPGDYILGNKFIYGMKLPIPFTDIKLPSICDPKPGDIVIFKYPLDPSQNYIKRCVAVAGQTVEIRNKQVYVDGQHMPLPSQGKYIDDRIIPSQLQPRWGMSIRDNMPVITVPEGKLFVMGDNRDNSADSRFWGFLNRDLVLGKALVVLWSWEYPEEIPVSNSAISAVDLWFYNVRHFPELIKNTRWNRTGMITR